MSNRLTRLPANGVFPLTGGFFYIGSSGISKVPNSQPQSRQMQPSSQGIMSSELQSGHRIIQPSIGNCSYCSVTSASRFRQAICLRYFRLRLPKLFRLRFRESLRLQFRFPDRTNCLLLLRFCHRQLRPQAGMTVFSCFFCGKPSALCR